MADPLDFSSLARLFDHLRQSASPDDYVMMRNMGFGPNASASGGNISSGPLSGSYKQFSDGPRVSEMGDARATIPLPDGGFGIGAGLQRDVGQGYSVSPGANLNVGPLSANYNRTFGTMAPPGGESYGAALKLGDTARLSYQRTRPGVDLPAINTFGVGLPVDRGSLDLSAAFGGAGGPQYRAGLTLGDILGGALSAGASYSPNNRDVSVQAKFRNQF